MSYLPSDGVHPCPLTHALLLKEEITVLHSEKVCGLTDETNHTQNGDEGEGKKKHDLVPYLKAPLKSDVRGSCWKCDICLGPLFT